MAARNLIRLQGAQLSRTDRDWPPRFLERGRPNARDNQSAFSCLIAVAHSST